MSNDNKLSIIMLGILIIPTILYFGVYEKWMLESEGRYTLAKYVGTYTGGRQGPSEVYEFNFSKKCFRVFIKRHNNNRHFTYNYCQFVPSNPDISRIENDIEVPYCVLPNNIPDSGWLELPKIKCPEIKPPLCTDRVEFDPSSNK